MPDDKPIIPDAAAVEAAKAHWEETLAKAKIELPAEVKAITASVCAMLGDKVVAEYVRQFGRFTVLYARKAITHAQYISGVNRVRAAAESDLRTATAMVQSKAKAWLTKLVQVLLAVPIK